MNLKNNVLAFIRRHQLITPGTAVMVGVSGGADSMVLAHILHELRHELSIRLHIVHFDHRLRKTSGDDLKCVEQFAKQLNVPFSAGKRSGRIKQASEDEARQWRLQYFFKAAKESKVHTLALGHTQNDAAETILMRIIRGSGLYGLRGILPKRGINGLNIIRPLLDISRQQIEDYAKLHRIKYTHDQTNSQTHYLRNKVRLKLLPLLNKDYNPQMSQALLGLAATAREDYEFLQQMALQRIKKNVATFAGKVKIKQSFIQKEHPAMRRLILRSIYEQLTGDVKQLTFSHVAEVEHLIASRPNQSVVHWPQSVQVKKTDKFLEFKSC